MADLTTANEVLEQAQVLANDAKTILLSDNATADDLEKADRIKAESTALHDRYAKLTDLENVLTQQIQKRDLAQEIKDRADETKDDDETDVEFKSLGEQAQAIYNRYKFGENHPALRYVDNEGNETKDLSTGVGADGGFLVPVQQMSQLLSAASQTAVVRPRATIIPMARRELTMPVLDQTGTDSAPHFFGGIQTYWQEEASSITQADPQFRNIRLIAHALVGYTRVSEELLADSAVGLDAFLRSNMGFAGAMTWTEEEAFINGTGAGQPLGIISAGVTSTVNRSVQTVVSYEDLLDMEAQLYSPTNNAVWMISQSQKANIMKMTGPSGNANYVYRPAAAEGEPATLLGRPVFFMLDHLPLASTTSAGDVLLADWNFYLVGDRQQITVDSTDQERWRFNQVSWKVTARLDGQPWLSAALTSNDGTTSVSPFVSLGAKTT